MKSKIITTSLALLLLSFHSIGQESVDAQLERSRMKVIVGRQLSAKEDLERTATYDLKEYGLAKGALKQCLLSPNNQTAEAVEARLLMDIRREILKNYVGNADSKALSLLDAYYGYYLQVISSDDFKKEFESNEEVIEVENHHGDGKPLWLMQYLSTLLPDILNGSLTREKIDIYIDNYAQGNEKILSEERVEFLKSIPMVVYSRIAQDYRKIAPAEVIKYLEEIGTYENLKKVYASETHLQEQKEYRQAKEQEANRQASLAKDLLRDMSECEEDFTNLHLRVHSEIINDSLNREKVEFEVHQINQKVRAITGVTTTNGQ